MKQILDSEQIARTLKRISHEIIEKNEALEDLVFVGIKSKGTPIAHLISENIYSYEGIRIPVEEIDISKYRDDHKKTDVGISNIQTSLCNKVIVLVDDVLFTGRSVRAAMDAIMDLGRARKIQLAVLIDRGHRELPIRPDFVGKNIPTSHDERVIVDITNLNVFIN